MSQDKEKILTNSQALGGMDDVLWCVHLHQQMHISEAGADAVFYHLSPLNAEASRDMVQRNRVKNI